MAPLEWRGILIEGKNYNEARNPYLALNPYLGEVASSCLHPTKIARKQ
jgi:hypothetical protein